jgi:hypothetical protein
MIARDFCFCSLFYTVQVVYKIIIVTTNLKRNYIECLEQIKSGMMFIIEGILKYKTFSLLLK